MANKINENGKRKYENKNGGGLVWPKLERKKRWGPLILLSEVWV